MLLYRVLLILLWCSVLQLKEWSGEGGGGRGSSWEGKLNLTFKDFSFILLRCTVSSQLFTKVYLEEKGKIETP